MAIKKRVKKVNFRPLFFLKQSKQHYLAYIINQITAKKEVDIYIISPFFYVIK